MILWQIHQIMQVGRRLHDSSVCLRIVCQQDLRGGPHAMQVLDIVGTVVVGLRLHQCDELRLPVIQPLLRKGISIQIQTSTINKTESVTNATTVESRMTRAVSWASRA